MSTPFNPVPYEVKDRKGSMITAYRGDHHVTRNASFFKKLPFSINVPPVEEEDEVEFEIMNPDIQVADRLDGERSVTGQLLRRSSRVRTPPS